MTRRRRSPNPACHRSILALYHRVQELGLTNIELCQRAGLNRDQLLRWSSGQNSPRVDDLEAMLNVVGLRLTVEPLNHNLENQDGNH